ncbi:FimB/Mfa2 family fimbrial subunit [Parabacteroides sp.]
MPEPPVVTPEPEPTPDPAPTDSVKTRTLRVCPDWSAALSESTLPETYLLRIGERTVTADARIIYMYRDSIPETTCHLLAYNEPEGITLAGEVASIHRTEKGLLIARPGYLFAADTTVSLSPGDSASITLPMRRLVAPITLTLNFTEPTEVSGANATLSGLIDAIRLPEGTAVEAPSPREATERTDIGQMDFEPLPDHRGIRFHARAFGIRPGMDQWLEASVTLSDGRTLYLKTDLSEYLRDFEHMEPIHLENEIDTAKPTEPEKPDPTPDPDPDPTPEPDPDTPANISAEIKDWIVVDGGEVEAK